MVPPWAICHEPLLVRDLGTLGQQSHPRARLARAGAVTTGEPRSADGEWIVYDDPALGRAGGWHVSSTPPEDVRDAEPRGQEAQRDLFA